MLRYRIAPNPSPMTLDGTRTYLVGEKRVALIDPGSSSGAHLDALANDIADARLEAVLVTHEHPDHATGAQDLAARFDAPVRGLGAGTLREGDEIATDAGPLRALHTPGHTPDHVAFDWREGGAIFVGDLMMGGQWTSLVAPPEGDLADYLRSLQRLRSLDRRTLIPAHGPAFSDAAAAIDAYVQHRMDRQRQVIDALSGGPADADAILARVYGSEVQPELRAAARAALDAYLAHLEADGRIQRRGTNWALTNASE